MATTAAPSPETYAAYFRDPNKDPLGVGATKTAALTRIYHEWRVDNGPPTPDDLYASVLDDFEDLPKGGIAIFKRLEDAMTLHIVHGIRKYPGDTHRVTSLDRKAFGYLEEIDGEDGDLVAFLRSSLDITAETNVATLVHHSATLEGDPGVPLLPPQANGAAATDTSKTRMSMFVPFELIPLLLDKELDARQVFLIVHAQLVALGLDAVCKPLLDFLRVSGTIPSLGSMPVTGLTTIGDQSPINKHLTKYMRRKVMFQHLPSLWRDIRAPDISAVALQAAVDTLSDAQLRACEATEQRQDERDHPRTILETFGAQTTTRLLRLCGKDVADEIPFVWIDLGGRKKGHSKQLIMADAMERAATELRFREPPTITTAIMSTISEFRFHGTDPFDVGSGVLPMRHPNRLPGVCTLLQLLPINDDKMHSIMGAVGANKN